ncbi:MAG: helix-turn-helix domain-containing protein [Gammaproteobacteria bacterium]|nr:helix-turn-helix domain-containing protein [Gammaproteobacteria bacterium]
MAFYGWRPYVSVAKRRAHAAREMRKLRKRGKNIEPVEIEGRKIARTFWGEAWCNHLEQFSDYENRLPRGRTYVRNGSVCHLAITKGKIQAIVSGSELYNIEVKITPLPAGRWKKLRKRCAGKIGSMLELLQGRLSQGVMEVVTHRDDGLFPSPQEIKLSCDCPDWAVMCKHVAAVLYGIGARLDQRPELLFLLRNVDHQELITAELDVQAATGGKGKRRRLATKDLSNVFGVEIEAAPQPSRRKKATPKKVIRSTTGRTAVTKKARPAVLVRKKSVTRKTAAKTSPKSPATRKKRVAAKSARAAQPRAVTRKKSISRKIAAQTRTKAPATTKKRGVTKPAGTPGKKVFNPTATTVARLRKRLDMDRSQFADLLNISQQTVANWENGKGKLNLRQRTKDALNQAAGLSRDEAEKKLL